MPTQKKISETRLGTDHDRRRKVNDDIKALADRLLAIEARLYALEGLKGELAETCDACNGTGQYVDYPAVSCPRCHSTESTTATETQSEVPESARPCTCGRVDLAAFDIGAGRTEAHSVDGILHIAHDSEHHGNRNCFAQLPEWRWAVDLEADYERAAKRSADDALARVLWLLSRLAEGHDTSRQLTHIVAVCEAQVGDGWQADPDATGIDVLNAWELLTVLAHDADLAGPRQQDWAVVGRAAARWLRDLTEGDK